MFLFDSQSKNYPLWSKEHQENPFPTYRQMHSDGAVVRSRISFMGKCWLTTNWAATNAMLRDQDVFARDATILGKNPIPGLLRFVLPKRFMTLASNMLARDGEDHRRLRSLADQAFLKSQVDQMQGQLEKLTDELLDQVIANAGRDNKPTDFVDEFARQLPLTVICEVLGLPEEDRPKFSEWFKSFAEVRNLFSIYKMIPGLNKLIRYIEGEFENVRKRPRPGLMSELVQMELDGDRLSKDELLSTIILLLIAGHETTTHLITTGLYSLLQHPDQKELLVSDWNHMGTAMDEILRFNSPVQMTKPRFVRHDTEFFGAKLKKGELVIAMLAAANADPEKFHAPETFDILRSPNPHVAFGSGVHICLGLKLAKAEAGVAFRRLLERFPNTRIEGEVTWRTRIGLRSIKNLPLVLET